MSEATGAHALGSDAAAGSEATGEVTEPEPERHAGAPVLWSRGQEVLHPARDAYIGAVRTLRDDEGFVMCADVTAVDYLERPVRDLPAGVAPERFEVVVNLVTLGPERPPERAGPGPERPPERAGSERARRVRLRVQVPEDDPTLPSMFDLYPGTEAMEREVFDLMGIRFDGHPDLTRILLPEDWEGHPLRKDYPVGRIPVQFKAAPASR